MLRTAWIAAWMGRLSYSFRSSGRALTRENLISADDGSVSVAKAALGGQAWCGCSTICLSRNCVQLLARAFYEMGCL